MQYFQETLNIFFQKWWRFTPCLFLVTILSHNSDAQCPTANFPTATVCVGDSLCLPNNSTDTCNSIVESRWYFYSDTCTTLIDSLILSGKSDVCYLYLSPGIKCVKLVVENTQGNTDTKFRLPTVLARPSANAVGDTTVCPGDTAQLNVSATGGNPPYSFSWSPSNTLTNGSIQNPKAFPDTTITYIATVSDDNGCSHQDTVRIRVSNPGTDAGPDFTICSGDSVVLGGFQGDTLNFSYNWSPSFGLDDSTKANPIAKVTTDTTYTLTITDNVRGCIFKDTMQVQVGQTKAMAWPDSIKFCAGGTRRIFAAGGIKYQWQPATYLSCTNCRSPLTTPTDSIDYSVIVSSGSCKDTASVVIQVHPLPSADAGQDTSLLCYPDTITLGGTPSVSGGSSPYNIQWTPNAALDNPSNANPNAWPATGTNYHLAVSDANGCQTSDSTYVLVSADPPAVAPPDTEVYIGQYVRLSTPQGDYNYQWMPDKYLDSPKIATPLARPLETTTYTIQTDSNNCVSTSQITITVKEKFDVFVPEAFTPNNDGTNDYLIVRGVGIAKIINFRIYNRWGQTVFSAQSVEKAMETGWDGTYQGQPMDMGNYAYFLVIEDFEGQQSTFKGAISLIR